MGSTALPNFMPQLIIVTLAAYLCEFMFFGDNLAADLNKPESVGIGSVGTVAGDLFQLIFFAPDGMPVPMTIVFDLLIFVPWLIVLVQLFIGLVPFT